MQDVLSVRQDDVLERRAREVWMLSPESASKLAGFSPEPGYLGLSRHAIRKLLPLMEEGLRYSEAVDKVYGFGQRKAPVALLPPVVVGLPHLRNPVVHRVLAEVRKVVNGIIREYGRPEVVRVELARDLKRTADQRKEAWKRNLDNRRAREEASARVLRETRDAHPSRRDVEKALLWDECAHVCPYTGKSINFSALFSPSPEFDIDHIVPFSRSLDDSFFNKTLCSVKENRGHKRNRTPWEAYGSDPARWNEIIERVKQFQGDARTEKLRRFQLREVQSLDDFASQQLNDTRQASKEALRYLGLLYGGFCDERGVRRVQASKGGITAYLRDVWNLGSVLGGGDGGKSRSDHRQHALDAIAVALTEPAIVKALSDAAARALREGRRRFGQVEEPWTGFLEDVRRGVEGIVVSHRPERKVGGALHAETLYSKAHSGPNGQPCRHIRRPLSALKKEADVDAIVDPVVRNILREKLGKLGGDLKKLAAPTSPSCLKDGLPVQSRELCAACLVPCLRSANGRGIPIKRVRVRERVNPVQIGQGARTRFVLTSANHHMEVVEEQTKRGPRWKGIMVPRLKAVNRLARKEPVVQRDHGGSLKFVFSVASGDCLEIAEDPGRVRIVVVRSVSEGKIEFVDARDARKKREIKQEAQQPRQNADGTKGGGWTTRSPEELRKLGCQKVTITPTGQVAKAHD
jgi:CRISPR-associated endonuclease Csn1